MSECEAMGCTSAKQVSAVPNDEEGRGKAYSNGDLFTGQYTHTHTKMSIKASQLHFTPLIAQRRPIAPSALTIYSLHYSSQSSGSVLSSPFQTITVNAAVLLESCMLTVHERVRK